VQQQTMDPALDPEVAAVAPPRPTSRVGTVVTALVLFGPFAGAILGAIFVARRETTVTSLAIAVVLYLLSGHGLSAGFHRMCTHRAFRATRATKIALVLLGSLTFEGGVLGWASNHRQHHAFTDLPGDPHSPHLAGSSIGAQLRGAVHAHAGWLFVPPPQDAERWIPDLLADHDLVVLDRLFPLWCGVSLAVPTLLGFAFTGTGSGALGGFIWGGLVRVFVLQQATFAVNSACHLFGRSPFRTRKGDQARNLPLLGIVAMGEGWHNLHHAMPRSVRCGVGHGGWDSTARLVWLLERAGMVKDVHWPDAQTLAARRRERPLPPNS